MAFGAVFWLVEYFSGNLNGLFIAQFIKNCNNFIKFFTRKFVMDLAGLFFLILLAMVFILPLASIIWLIVAYVRYKKYKNQPIDDDEMLEYVVDEKTIKDEEQDISDYNLAVGTNKTQLKQAESDAAGRKKIDVAELENTFEAQKETVESARSAYNTTDNRIQNNADRRANISGQKGDLEKAIHEYSISKFLYELVKGSTGSGKITLEQYMADYEADPQEKTIFQLLDRPLGDITNDGLVDIQD